MYGLELERGLDQALRCDVVLYDPQRSVIMKETGGRRLQKKRILSHGLIIEKDREADRREAVDSICRFGESPAHGELPPVILQYTLQLRNVDKLERFVRLAQFRGGKHLYVLVDPGNEDEYQYYLFIAAQFLRKELYALATDPDPNAIWILSINRKYKATVYREPNTVIARLKRRLGKRRQSKTRALGDIIAIKHGRGFIAPVDGGDTMQFDFDNVVDSSLRLVLQNADRHNLRDLVFDLRVSFEARKDASSEAVHAISVLAEVDLATLKKTLYQSYVALEDKDATDRKAATL